MKNIDDLKGQLYRFDARLVKARERIADNTDLLPENRDAILAFIKSRGAQGTSKSRLLKYAYSARALGLLANKPFARMNTAAVEELVLAIDKSDYEITTRRDLKVCLKLLFSHIRGCRPGEYAPEVAWIRARAVNPRLSPEDLLTEDEVNKMLDAALNERDKALLATIYYSNCRIGELLTLMSDKVHDKGTHLILEVDGKTGPRRVPIVEGIEPLKKWLANHPRKAEGVFPVFTSIKENKPLRYWAARKIVQELAVRAGITKKVHPHLFRHSRSTELAASGMNDALLNQLSGWSQGSKMPGVYLSLSSKQVENAVLELANKKKVDAMKDEQVLEELFELSLQDKNVRETVMGVFGKWLAQNKSMLHPYLERAAKAPAVLQKFAITKGAPVGI